MVYTKPSRLRKEAGNRSGEPLRHPKALTNFFAVCWTSLGRLEECSAFEFAERLPELLLRVHHDRAVPRHRLFEGLARDQKKTDSVVPGLHRDLVAPIEQDQRAIIGLGRRMGVRPLYRFCRDSQGTRSVAKLACPGKYVSEGM